MNIALLKQKKKELHLTFEDLSQQSGVPIQTLHNIFRGYTENPRIDTIQAIERALGLSSAFTDEDYKNGVTDTINIQINVRQFEWLQLGNEAYESKGPQYYNALYDMIKAALNQK